MRRLPTLFLITLAILLMGRSVALADNCSSKKDCEETAGYNTLLALAGGVIAILTALFGNELAQVTTRMVPQSSGLLKSASLSVASEVTSGMDAYKEVELHGRTPQQIVQRLKALGVESRMVTDSTTGQMHVEIPKDLPSHVIGMAFHAAQVRLFSGEETDVMDPNQPMKIQHRSAASSRDEQASPGAQAEPKASEGAVSGRSIMDLVDWFAKQGGEVFKELSAEMRKAILETAEAVINRGLEKQEQVVIQSLQDLVEYTKGQAVSSTPEELQTALKGIQNEWGKLRKARDAYYTLSFIGQEDQVIAKIAKEAEITRKTAKNLMEMGDEQYDRMRAIWNEIAGGPAV